MAHQNHDHHLDGSASWAHRHAEQSLDRTAFQAIVRCLTGCAIGEVLPMVIGTALGLSNLANHTRNRTGFLLRLFAHSDPSASRQLALPTTLGLAFASDTASITIMQIVEGAQSRRGPPVSHISG